MVQITAYRSTMRRWRKITRHRKYSESVRESNPKTKVYSEGKVTPSVCLERLWGNLFCLLTT